MPKIDNKGCHTAKAPQRLTLPFHWTTGRLPLSHRLLKNLQPIIKVLGFLQVESFRHPDYSTGSHHHVEEETQGAASNQCTAGGDL